MSEQRPDYGERTNKDNSLNVLGYKRPLTKAELLKTISNDFEFAQKAQKQAMQHIDYWRRVYGLPREQFIHLVGNDAGPELEDVDEIDNIYVRDATKIVRWIISNVKSTITANDMVKLKPVGDEDAMLVLVNQELINKQMERDEDLDMLYSRVLPLMFVDGTAVCRVRWEEKIRYIDEEIIPMIHESQIPELMASRPGYIENGGQNMEDGYIKDFSILKRKVVRAGAKFEPVPLEDIYFEPTYGKAPGTGFIIQRYVTTVAELLKEDITRNPAGRFQNVDALITKLLQKAERPEHQAVSRFSDLAKGGVDDDYRPLDYARTQVVLYDYWGELDLDGSGELKPVNVIFSNEYNEVLYQKENNLPDKEPPFIVSPLYIEPFSAYGLSPIDWIGDFQRYRQGLLRVMLENALLMTNNIVIVPEGMFDPDNLEKLEKRDVAGIIEARAPGGFDDNDIKILSPQPLPDYYFKLFSLLGEEIENETGITKYTQGLDADSLNKTASGIGMIMNASQRRLEEFINRVINGFIRPMIQKAMVYNAAYLTPDYVNRIVGEDIGQHFQPGLIDIEADIDIEAYTKGQEELAMQQTMTLLSTCQPYIEMGVVPEDIIMDLISDLFYSRGRSAEAKKIKAEKEMVIQKRQEAQQAQMQMQQEQLQFDRQVQMKELMMKEQELEIKKLELMLKYEETKQKGVKVETDALKVINEVTQDPKKEESKNAGSGKANRKNQ